MKVDQVIDAIMIAIKPNVSAATAVLMRKSLVHLAVVARLDAMLDCDKHTGIESIASIKQCSDAINKAMISSRK